VVEVVSVSAPVEALELEEALEDVREDVAAPVVGGGSSVVADVVVSADVVGSPVDALSVV